MKRQNRSFITPLIVSPLPDGKRWQLKKPFKYASVKYSWFVISIRTGFITDFASVPRLFWSLIPRWGKWGKSAVVHDFLYQTGVNRKLADEIFLEGMEILGVVKWRRLLMYWAVRLFGWLAWKKRR